MKLEASTRLQASADEDVISTTAIAYERKQPSGKWTPRHVVVSSKDAAAKLRSLKSDPKVRNPKVVSASTTLECGCVSAKVCAHSVSALTEKQKQLDIDGDGKIDGDDLKKVRQGALASSKLEAATPKEAAAYVVQVFAKQDIRVALSKNQSDDEDLVFNLWALGQKHQFSLTLDGKKVRFDSLGSSVFDPANEVADVTESRANRTKLVDFAKVGSAAFDKWEDSTNDLVADLIVYLNSYKNFVQKFTTAMNQITQEMQKAK